MLGAGGVVVCDRVAHVPMIAPLKQRDCTCAGAGIQDSRTSTLHLCRIGLERKVDIFNL